MASKPDKPKLPPVPTRAELERRGLAAEIEQRAEAARALETGPAQNSEPAAPASFGRPFQKGAPSANPGGRPKAVVEVIEQLRDALPEAAATLVSLLKSPNHKVRLAAAREVFDRVVGRPKQTIDINPPEDPMQRLIDAVNGLAQPKKPETPSA